MFGWLKSRKPVQATEKARNALGMTISHADDGAIRTAIEAANFVVQDVPLDISEAIQNAALENVGSARPLIKANKYEVATHLETAARMVDGLTARGNALHVEGVADHEDFERFKAEKLEEIRIREEELQAANARRTAEVAEIERLLRFYRAAPELTAKEELALCHRYSPPPVDPAAMDAVGEKIAQIRNPNPKRRTRRAGTKPETKPEN